MSPLEELASRFRFNEKALALAVDGFGPSDWLHTVAGATSHAYWIVGHLALARRNLLRGTGYEHPVAAWERAFVRGSKPGPAATDPPPAALLEDIVESGRLLAAHLPALTPEEAASPYPRTFADGSSTKGGAAHFLYWHEAYHLGQLGLLRRAAGKSGVA
jgi:hypothetical protein